LKRTPIQRIKAIPNGIWENKYNIVVVVVWSVLIAVIAIIQYNGWIALVYGNRTPDAFYSSSGASLSSIDFVAILLASLVFGAFVNDIIKILVCEISTLVISTAISTVYITNFIWLHTQVNGFPTSIVLSYDYGWSWAVYWGFLNVFREFFPVAIGIVFFSGFVGAILRSYFGYS
jgi:hypothetical protein